MAVLLLFGHSLEETLTSLSKTRPFLLENQGFQRQVVELEAMLATVHSKASRLPNNRMRYAYADPTNALSRHSSSMDNAMGLVEIELLIPGLCVMDVKIPKESSIAEVKERLKAHANKFFLSYSKAPATVAKSWVVLAMFGHDDKYDFPLEKEAIEIGVQLGLMKRMFGLEVFTPKGSTEQLVRWNSRCRFALVIFSVFRDNGTNQKTEEPWTFKHAERPGAPATFLQYNLRSTHLRAWDFVTGQSYSSTTPIVFSFSPDPRDKRQFMRISTSANEPVQFHAPGEGGILGMGANAIVHRVILEKVVDPAHTEEPGLLNSYTGEDTWDAAVKRHFCYEKMVASLENRSEAGLAKRIRMARSLNSDRRVVEFYGLGVGLSSNSYNEQEFKFEAMLLARYEEEFSTYTMKKFMQDYLAPIERVSVEERAATETMQSNFSLISVKVLLVSLLNAFRDLTLMGVQAFDFNHLSNVLVSRDHTSCRLIDIDGDSKGSIQLDYTTEPSNGSGSARHGKVPLYKPSLDIDLDTVLPTVVEQLILGKGRGRSFVTNTRSEIWRAEPTVAKEIIQKVLRENFYPNVQGEEEIAKADTHTRKVSQWFYACLKKQAPWGNWTRDIYDVMRCIDHLPIT